MTIQSHPVDFTRERLTQFFLVNILVFLSMSDSLSFFIRVKICSPLVRLPKIKSEYLKLQRSLTRSAGNMLSFLMSNIHRSTNWRREQTKRLRDNLGTQKH